MRWVYQADWVYTGSGPPVRNGCVLIEGGLIRDIGTHAPQHIPVQRCEQSAIVPLLVNSHTHLEFSSLAEPLQPLPEFAHWIRAVVAWRRSQGEHRTTALRMGLEESAAMGVGTLGEIATSDWLAHPELTSLAAENGQQLVVFRELLGLSPTAIRPQLEIAQQHLAGPASTGLVRGLSPHAPYSVHPELFTKLIELARGQTAVPVAMHLAETRAELELLACGSGPLVELLQEFGVWQPHAIARGTRPRHYLEQLATLAHSLVIHGNYLAADEIDLLAANPQMSVVYCPRTHAAMGHSPHPWRTLLERGINVALGTDSRASNPDLSLWEELRLLHRLAPELPTSALLPLATTNGARALGRPHGRDGLVVGSPANMLCVALLPDALNDPEQYLLTGEFQPTEVCRFGKLFRL